jgi:Glycogen recognition site of AMP-activated protein kinase
MKQEHEGLGPDAERFERIVGALDRRPVRLPSTVRAAVMARIRGERSSAWARAWAWLAAPQLSPLAAAVALAAGIAVLLLSRPQTPTRAPTEAQAGSVTIPVRLIFLAPRANRVAVTGDFASWDPNGIPLAGPHGDGVWSVELRLAPGLHHYVFIVDGTEWRPDPNAASQVDDGFGQKNSVLVVPGPRAS